MSKVELTWKTITQEAFYALLEAVRLVPELEAALARERGGGSPLTGKEYRDLRARARAVSDNFILGAPLEDDPEYDHWRAGQ